MDMETLKSWYGFIYTQNVSAYALDAQIELNLLGIEVVWPLNAYNSE